MDEKSSRLSVSKKKRSTKSSGQKNFVGMSPVDSPQRTVSRRKDEGSQRSLGKRGLKDMSPCAEERLTRLPMSMTEKSREGSSTLTSDRDSDEGSPSVHEKLSVVPMSKEEKSRKSSGWSGSGNDGSTSGGKEASWLPESNVEKTRKSSTSTSRERDVADVLFCEERQSERRVGTLGSFQHQQEKSDIDVATVTVNCSVDEDRDGKSPRNSPILLSDDDDADNDDVET